MLAAVLFFSFVAKGQVAADFSASSLQGCAPLVVQFTDISVGSPTTWFWDLGNGNTSTAQNPGTIYFNPGTYTVKLMVSNATSIDSIEKISYITVYENPTVIFNTPDSAGCSPFFVPFTDASLPGSGNIMQWQWDFGDGNTSTLQFPTNTFAAGSFNITLKITNSQGCASSLTRSGYIKAFTKPIAGFTTLSSSNCNPPVIVNYSNTSTGGSIVTYSWDFGDGTTSAIKNPSHNFTTPGVFNTVLIVINQAGCQDTITKIISIGAVSPDFTAPDTVCVNTGFTITNTSAPSIVSSLWSFGDGTTSTQNNPLKLYSASGVYNIKLINNFGACKDSVTKKIVVVNKPTARFNYNAPPTGCTIPITVTFTSTSVGAIFFNWSFGDGNSSALANPNHIYTAKGLYSVRLIVTNASGCTDTIVKQNIISITEPVITGISGLPFIGCVPFTNTFTPTITTPEPVITYQWNFGDNTTSAQPSPTHTYNNTGTYDVSLIVTTTNGCKDTIKIIQAVKIGTRPAANFTATPLTGCAIDSVHFTNTTIGANTAWSWSFGDTTYSAIENPVHHYIDTGLFTVMFVAENNGCKDTAIKQDYIYIKPPVAYFTVKNYCDSPFVKRFINRSISAVTHLWDFGDGTTSAIKNPVHTYAATGTYVVKLRVDNPPCYDEFTDTIYVFNEQPVISIGSNPVCKNVPVIISATGISPANIRQYLWTLGDTSTPTITTVPQISHTYTASGTYNLTLKITDKLGCRKTVTSAVPLLITGPKAKVSHPAGACVNSNVTFTDQSLPYTGNPIVSWTIDYGDGTIVTSATPVFSHVYATTDTFVVKYSITDNAGCKDTYTDAIIITKITVDFGLSDSISCRQSLINFINTSTAGSVTYLWNFGDGTTSNLRNPWHIYTTGGYYNISLKIKDKNGCVDSLNKDSLLHIINAKAAFDVSDSILACPPAQVSFTNNSTFFTTFNWDFGDGSTSTILNPTHFFLNGGTYNVKLNVNGYGSCKDSAVKKIKVTGPRGIISYSPLGLCVPGTVTFSGFATNVTGNFIWDFGDGTTVISSGSATTHTYTTVGHYVPRLLLQDTTINCSVAYFGKDTITVSDADAIIKLPIQGFCDSANISFIDSSIITYDSVKAYSWTFGDGSTASTQNPTHIYTSPGNYTINMNLVTVNGCKDTAAPVSIKVIQSPSITITADTSGCINSPVTFTLTLQQPDTSVTKYKWTFANGNTSAVQNPPAQTYATPNTYIVKATALNTSGCTDTATHKLVIHPLPVVDAGPDSTICKGQSLILTPSGAISYVWKNNAATLSCTACTNPVAKPATSAKYIVTGKSNFGCFNKDSVSITVVQPFSIVASLRDTICKGQSITLSASGTDNYTWSPASGLSSAIVANPTAKPDTTTVYRVVGTDYKSCFTDTAYVPVIVYTVPQFRIVPNVLSIAVGNTVAITSIGSADIISYKWTPAIGLSCNNCSLPIASPIKTTTYTATVANIAGCKTQSQVTINLLCGEGNIYVPNTFSPNGDGSNDVFYPRGKGINGIRNMQIFNRWGLVVFERTNLSINDETAGWNGTYKGQPASQDVYVYHLEVLCANGEKFLYKGDVTLIR